jgi:hypothetical protein
MAKRNFLVPLALSVAALLNTTPADSSFPTHQRNTVATRPMITTQTPQQDEGFVLERPNTSMRFAGHSSHSSHASHGSHCSGYSYC